jgi:D-inositol-3-phosphate glycosyltransferase
MNVYVLQMAKELGRRGWKADVFTRWHDPDDSEIVDLGENARVVHLRAGPYSNGKESLYSYIPEFLSNLYRFKDSEGIRYDLIHSHYWLSGRAGMVLSQKWGAPHVATFHTLARKKLEARVGEKEPELRISTEHRVLDSADAVVVATEQEREDLVRLYGASPHKIRVIEEGVDLELFHPGDKREARRALGVEDENVVLYVGRIQPLKGLDILLRAMALLRDGANTRLMTVGGDLERDQTLGRLQTMAKGLGIRDRVTFTGAMKHTELPNYYRAADVFVLPSRYESFGLAPLEAMACGTPVVASRVGGLTSYIREGRNGYLVPWRCPEPFAQRLDALLANPSLVESMGRAAREQALKMSWDGVADRMLSLYTRLEDEPLHSS